jgi:gluconate 5-dehydrogenase
LGEPADLRGLVVFLASDASRYVVGESVVIDGGYTLV